MNLRTSATTLLRIALCAAVAGTSSIALAASGNWDGSASNLWSDVANWSSDPNPVPGTGDTATFNAAGNGSPVDLGAGVTINTILFDTASAAAYIVGNAATPITQLLTLDNGGAVTVNNSVVNNQTINANVTLGTAAGSFTVTNNSANTLTFGGTVTGAALAAQTLTVAGSGNTTITGVLNDGAGAGSILSLVKQGAGYLKLNALLPTPNTNIEGSLDIQGGAVGATGDLTVRGLTGTGTLENGGPADKWFFCVINSGTNTFNGILQNGSNTGLLGLVKQGAGTLVLTNNSNNLNSNLSTDQGKLLINNTGTYGMTLAGGVLRTGTTAIVGNVNNQNAVMEINGATVVYNNRSGNTTQDEAFRGTLSIATNGAGRVGVVRFNSGTLSLYRQLAVGAGGGTTAGI